MAVRLRIRLMRQQRGLSMAKLAQRADLDPATLYRIESEKTDPRLSTLERIADALMVETSDLIVPRGAYASPNPNRQPTIPLPPLDGIGRGAR